MKLGYWLLVGALIISIGLMLGTVIGADAVGANVAVIPLVGPITIDGAGDLLTGEGTSSTDVARWIEEADAAGGVEIILLEINSPGGTAVASDEIARAVERADKPVVAWIREIGASGAYWAASEADHVVANRMSITGSVGVIASYLEFADFLEEHNITHQELTAGELKGIGNPFDDLSYRERRILQEKLDITHDFFLTDVQENRNLTDEQLDEVRTGVFFLGVEAMEMGLVDELGGRHEIEQHLRDRLDRDPVYRRYERPKTFFEELAGVRTPILPDGLRIMS